MRTAREGTAATRGNTVLSGFRMESEYKQIQSYPQHELETDCNDHLNAIGFG